MAERDQLLLPIAMLLSRLLGRLDGPPPDTFFLDLLSITRDKWTRGKRYL